jgi:hypothetical protein
MDVNSLLAKGNSFITRRMYRGIRGELIRQPWFVNFRRQSPDQFVYVTYGVGLLLSLVLGLMPGVIGTIITDLIWAGLIYLYFALGTKLGHQFIAYGISAVGAMLALLSALYTLATFVDLASLHFAGTAVLLLITLGGTVVSGIVGLCRGQGAPRNPATVRAVSRANPSSGESTHARQQRSTRFARSGPTR